jgi:hypothetical protein
MIHVSCLNFDLEILMKYAENVHTRLSRGACWAIVLRFQLLGSWDN